MILVCAAVGLAGCAATDGGEASKPAPAPVAAAPSERVIARMSGAELRESELNKMLQDIYGLDLMIKLVMRELARTEAARAGVRITPEDVKTERYQIMRGAFPDVDSDEYEKLLPQLLSQLKMSTQELDLVIETNAYLRAIAKPMIAPKLTDDVLREAFNGMYGEKVRVRHIAVVNLQDATRVRKRLNEGEDFAKVAREESRVPGSAREGGALPPFSRNSVLGKAFVDTAFALKVGEISDPVQQDNLYHIIKAEERIAPVVVKFEDYRQTVRETMEQSLTEQQLLAMRQELVQRTLRELRIDDPGLKKQFDTAVEAANKPADKAEVLEKIK
jgi:foldase protein PrsA